MSLREIAERLERSLATSARLLDQLRQGLQQHRTSWVSARPSLLAAPAERFDPIAQALAAEERTREELLTQARALLPTLPGVDAAAQHVNVSTIAAALPPALAARLRKAAAATTAQSRAVRGEVALGNRLLAFSQRVQEATLGDAACERTDAAAYDRNARRVAALSRTGAPAAGSLIDGRM